MLSKKDDAKQQIEFVSIDQLVPQDHLLRKIEKVIKFDFIYDLVKDKYSKDYGRTSIDPVVLIKILFIQYLFGIPSLRRTIAEIKTNVPYFSFFSQVSLHKILYIIPHKKKTKTPIIQTYIFKELEFSKAFFLVTLRIFLPSLITSRFFPSLEYIVEMFPLN
ncbi:MAG: hypothetical protein PWP18_1270, partial [Thermoanaerobacter sp.]|nr:transposase [Thermoanaerobacter sp.]MDK2815357.1 hypothetical protein [Thermoanaerobacter sp.]